MTVCDSNIAPLLPSFSAIQRNIQMIRKKSTTQYIVPENASQLIIPEEFHYTFREEQFLIFDSGINTANRIIIFSSLRCLNILSNSPHIYFDATFKVVQIDG
ncbi:hypothetical protein RF11_05209 [Thelohanellus kitauei]|uniref:Uncharacterized protein n=1 Tax=Thelohanellus kitauei TaxID=669202 RepID=A0A0C2IB48_THEKT|nr:hypothetical protein RF11_05209 [Thelohanellus kitauei]